MISRAVWSDVIITLIVAITLNVLYSFILILIRSSRTKTSIRKPFVPQKFLTLRISNIPRDATTENSLRAFFIIAVTGLAGHAFGSWKAKNLPHMWLRDFLPQSIPNARILTYGYDTKIYGSQSEESILELAKALLESIKTTRQKSTTGRPLIFIAHSLGGLVVKEALVQASVGSEEDQTIYRSCYVLLLFGVPNRGLNNLALKSMVKGQPNESLVRDLGESSRFLSLLHVRFNACFAETKHTATWNSESGTWDRTGPQVMMVGHTSATNAHQNEKTYNRLSINSDHSEMVKFGNISNHDYPNIQSRLVDLVNGAPGAIRQRFDHHTRKITQLEKQFLRNLKAPDSEAFRNDKVGDRTPGTLGWFLQNHLYQSWKSAESSSGLWIQGSPGQGKTMLAKFILDKLEESVPNCDVPSAVIYFFFYDQDEIYRTAGGAMRSLIIQLLHLAPEAFQTVTEVFDIESPSISDNSLRHILKALLQVPQLGTIYCVIDGLDECQNDAWRKMLLDLIIGNLRSSSTRRRSSSSIPMLKTVFTSRPTVDIHGELHHLPNIQPKANHADLEIFIKSKVHELRFHQDLKQKAVSLLSSRVEQTFLWISIVLRRLNVATPLLSEAGMEEMINESPSDLETLFESIIGQIKQAQDVTAQKLLIWAVYSKRPLTLDELEEAIAVQDDSTSKSSTKKYAVALTESGVTTATGVILEIMDGRIHLVHQSAKEFLLKSKHLADFAFCMSLHPTSYLAKVCMTYLCFTDIVNPRLNRNNESYPFLQYTARNWYRHLDLKDDMNKLAGLISRLTEPKSPTLLAWGEVNGIVNLEEASDTWEVAVKVDIPWLVELQTDYTVITEEMIKKATAKGMTEYDCLRRLVNKRDALFTESELCLVVQHLDHALVRQILSKQPSAVITQKVFEAAAANVKYGRLVVEAILEFNNSFIMSVEFILLAQGYRVNGKDIIQFVIDDHNIEITEGGVQKIITGRDYAMVDLLLKREQINGLQFLLDSAVSRVKYEMVMRVLDRGGNKLTISERDMMAIVERFHHDATAMKKNQRKHLLLFLLKERGEDFQISEEMLKTHIRTEDAKNEALKFLLAERNDEIHMMEDIWKAAAANTDSNDETISLLLRVRGHELHLSEDVLRSAARNHECGYKIIKMLLKMKGDDVHVAEAILKEVVGSSFGQEDRVRLLAEFQRRGIWIDTEKMATIAAATEYPHFGMKALLDISNGEMKISEQVLKEVARNELGYASNCMELVLETKGVEEHVTEDVLIAAASNATDAYGILEAILDRVGDTITITEDILKAMVIKLQGHEMAKLIRMLRRNDVEITEGLLVLTASDCSNRDKMLFFFRIVLKAAVAEKSWPWILCLISLFKRSEVRISGEIRETMSRRQLCCWAAPEKCLPTFILSSLASVDD
ncbi:hypothetical protein ACQKWADRAFT_323791 [Trichoderma austrokoningii]